MTDKSADRRRRWAEQNPKKVREAHEKYRNTNRQQIRELGKHYRIKARYGISIEQRDAMFAAQGFACAACEDPKPNGMNWHVDHSHSKSHVRGILCSRCNLALGHAKEDVKRLYGLIGYLQRTRDPRRLHTSFYTYMPHNVRLAVKRKPTHG